MKCENLVVCFLIDVLFCKCFSSLVDVLSVVLIYIICSCLGLKFVGLLRLIINVGCLFCFSNLIIFMFWSNLVILDGG